MAFIDFDDAGFLILSASIPRPPSQSLASERADPLSAIERRVVELAHGDGLDTLRPRRKRGWLARLILGPMPASSMLANERLEALRRLAVQAWHQGYCLPASAIKDAQIAGFSETQVGAVIDSIGRSRAPARRLAA